MIQSVINTITALTSNNAPVVFQRDDIRTNSCLGCRSWLCHSEGSSNYDIVSGGIYKIEFNATVSSAATGAIAFALFKDGEQIPGTLMVETIAAAGNYADIGISKKIRICCNETANISVRTVPTVPNTTSTTTPATPVTTQIPIIVNANLILDKNS